MQFPKKFIPALALWAATLGVGAGLLPAIVQAAPVKTEHVTAELVAESRNVRPGEPIKIGLKLQHIPHWHTYWRNPGDSGLPTTLKWTLPEGSTTTGIDWPAPKRLPLGPLVNYGYEGELLLPLTFTPPANAKPGDTLQLKARADWLVCNDVCVPENAELDLALAVIGPGTPLAAAADRPLFERHVTARPVPLQGWTTRVQSAGRELLLELQAPADADASVRPVVHFFPYKEQLIEPARHDLYRTAKGYAVKFKLLDDAQPPQQMDGLVVAQVNAQQALPWGGSRSAVQIQAPVENVAALALPAGAEPMDSGNGLPGAAPAGSTAPKGGGTAAGTAAGAGLSTGAPVSFGGGADLGLWTALALAFFGGALLNLMPCVFPVLSIKLLGLAQHHDKPGALRSHALAYTAGVVLSFVALAAALLALRAAGSAIGWGFQLQEPGVVFVLAILFFALGLNLMGAFEFGNLMPQSLAGWRAQRPSVDAFASGVLAVVAASPCTAPFMGAALGYAITQSPVLALGVFFALGLGMALPYAALVLLPGWRSKLPRPGPWMLTLKQFLAFPMFATVVWLVWVLGQQSGVDGAAKVLLALVGFAFVVWLSGRVMARALIGKAIGAAALVALLAWSWPGASTPAIAAQGSAAAGAAEAAWLPYDEAAIAQNVAAGKPVFVDFTAAWCVSCQVNKRLVLHTDATMQAFEKSKVVLMRADWTNRDARITEALGKLGRNGVPVYLLIRPGREPLLLPEVLTGRIVSDALATL